MQYHLDNMVKNINNNIENFLEKEDYKSSKIDILEDKVNKMEYYLQGKNIISNIDENSLNEDETRAVSNYIRKGILQSEYVTKSFSSGENEGEVLIRNNLKKKIISAINNKSPMRKLAKIENISSRALDIIIENGDFTNGWIGEVAERVDTDTPQLIKKTIECHEIYAQPKATQSIIDDAEIDVEGWLIERLSDSFVRLENDAFINGDGDGKPFGILSNQDIERVANPEDQITPNSLLALINKLDEGYLATASFVMNRNSLSAIQGMRDQAGRLIWQQSLSDPLKQTIFGIPVVVSHNMPDAEAGSTPIAFGDFKSAYRIVDRSDIKMLRDPYTNKPFVRFYTVKRVGGDVVNSSALKFLSIPDAQDVE